MFFENRFTMRAEHVLRAAHESAAELGHAYVGSEHILLGLLCENDGIAAKVLKSAGITADAVKAKIRENIGFGAPCAITPQGLTPRSKRIVEVAFSEASHMGNNYVGTEHLLLGILREGDSIAMRLLLSMNANVTKIKSELVRALGGNDSEEGADYRSGRSAPRPSRDKNAETKTLGSFGRDLTEIADAGTLDPVIGREREITRMIQILSRRTKNNPVLIGEPGVGKTAIVEGLAQRIVSGNVPQSLRGKRLFMIDISGMVAGTKYRGEFEERIKTALREVNRAGNIILFIDEIHTIVGAGSAEGAVDAANILKPALSRGEIQIIGATTVNEYKKYIERDGALERRFQSVIVGEPTQEEAIRILTGLRDRYEAHHRIKISDDAIRAAVSMSARYINDRRLPDKAVDLIDEAASSARLYALTPPPRIKELEESIARLENEKEEKVRAQEFENAAHLRDTELKLRAELKALNEHMRGTGGEEIGAEHIASAVSEQTGIPVVRLTKTEGERLSNLENELHLRVVGQDEAVSAVARAVRRGRIGMNDPRRPIGSFMFAGPTGVGKTELCRALAASFFGDESMLIRMDMSEYMEKHTVSRLVGSPPGYVGYDDGGQLTEKVRRKPYSVILFDEIEKAHPDVFNMLLQILEDGMLTDTHGRRADFKNTIIVMTSNVGARNITSGTRLGFSDGSYEMRQEEIKKNVTAELKRSFRPEFINRIDDIIVFRQLDRTEIGSITRIMLKETVDRARAIGITLEITDAATELLADRGFDPQYGARPLRRVIRTEIEDRLSEIYLAGEENGERRCVADVNDGEITVNRIQEPQRE